jgi:hypothetical protein
LNNISKALNVGTISITLNGNQVEVTYNMKDGYSISEAHIYAGATTLTTLAPGEYGNTAYFDLKANTHNKVITLDSAPSQAYVIAHAVVYVVYPDVRTAIGEK